MWNKEFLGIDFYGFEVEKRFKNAFEIKPKHFVPSPTLIIYQMYNSKDPLVRNKISYFHASNRIYCILSPSMVSIIPNISG